MMFVFSAISAAQKLSNFDVIVFCMCISFKHHKPLPLFYVIIYLFFRNRSPDISVSRLRNITRLFL